MSQAYPHMVSPWYFTAMVLPQRTGTASALHEIGWFYDRSTSIIEARWTGVLRPEKHAESTPTTPQVTTSAEELTTPLSRDTSHENSPRSPVSRPTSSSDPPQLESSG